MRTKKINILETLSKNNINLTADKSNYAHTRNFEELKNVFGVLSKARLLDFFRFDPNYLNIMQNTWLLEAPISKYGVFDAKEDVPNTLPAFQKAIDKKFTLLIPVQILKDGNLVCFKEKTLGSLTNENGYIANFDYSELKKIKLNSDGLNVPLLKDVLDLVAGKVPVIIEIMNEFVGKMEEALLKELLEYIEKYNCYSQIALLSMNPYSLEWFYRHAPYFTRIIKGCYFDGVRYYASIPTKKLKKLKYANKVAHADFIAYNSKNLPNPYIQKHKPYGIIAYGVTDQNEYKEILEFSDNVIFSNFEPQI